MNTYWDQPQPEEAPKQKPRRRWFMWTFLAIQVVFLVWIPVGIDAAKGAGENCTGLDAQTCHDAATAGTAIGVGIIIALWVAIDLIIGITYLIIRLARKGYTP